MKSHIHAMRPNGHQQRQQSENKWAAFLNTTLGLLGYPLGLACLTTKTPSLNAAFTLAFLLAIWFTGRHLVPAHFIGSKKHRSPNHYEDERSIKDTLRFLLITLPAIFGYMYLCVITFSHAVEWYCGFSGHACTSINLLLRGYVGAPGY